MPVPPFIEVVPGAGFEPASSAYEADGFLVSHPAVPSARLAAFLTREARGAPAGARELAHSGLERRCPSSRTSRAMVFPAGIEPATRASEAGMISASPRERLVSSPRLERGTSDS